MLLIALYTTAWPAPLATVRKGAGGWRPRLRRRALDARLLAALRPLARPPLEAAPPSLLAQT